MTKAIHNNHNTDKFLLHDAIDEWDNILDEELGLVILPPDNVDGNTNNDVGSDTELKDINLDQFQEVYGTVEVSTRRKTTRVKKKEAKDQKLSKKKLQTKSEEQNKKESLIHARKINLDEKIDTHNKCRETRRAASLGSYR